MLKPTSIDELAEAVRTTPRVLAVGAQTKDRLSALEGVTRLSIAGLQGIIEYEPSEFTFTARAGTPLREIIAALGNEGQHLPFDPMLVDAGSTLGGTVASGLNGPGRLRFGGLRDFILGVRFLDGEGRILRMGGKVVKNAAGFDLPKFLVGSLGRFGILAEITFKVFPRPESTLTLEFAVADDAEAVGLLESIPISRWEPQAVDYAADRRIIHVRLGGPPAALLAMGAEMLARWHGRALDLLEADAEWRSAREFSWVHPGGSLLKLVFHARRLLQLDPLLDAAPGLRLRVSAGGDLAFVSVPHQADWEAIGGALRTLELPALTLRGEAPLHPGFNRTTAIATAVKRVVDPSNRFPDWDSPR